RLGGDGVLGSAGEAVGREEVEAGIADVGPTGVVPSAVVRGLLDVAATLRSDTTLWSGTSDLCFVAILLSFLRCCRWHVFTPVFPKRPCACSCACLVPARAHAGSCLLLRTGSAPSFPANASMPVLAAVICPLGAGAPC